MKFALHAFQHESVRPIRECGSVRKLSWNQTRKGPAGENRPAAKRDFDDVQVHSAKT